jgi:hypothetical protein
MSKREVIFRAPVGKNGKVYDFHSNEKMSEFLSKERAFYSRIIDADAVRRNDFTELRSSIAAQFTLLAERCQLWQTDPSNKQQLSEAFQSVYISFRLPLSSSPEGKLVESLLSTAGPLAAASALAVFLDLLLSVKINSAQIMRGLVSAATFSEGASEKNLP